MKLRGYDWGNVFNSSGARGFFGEGYWYHDFWRPFGLSYQGSTFVAKTTTLNPRAGNMPLAKDGVSPKEAVPKCIVVKPFKGVVLNSVGLSGPGAKHLISRWLLMPNLHRIVMSFMSTASEVEDRIHEATEFARLLPEMVKEKGTLNLALQINFSCPNVKLDVSSHKTLASEMTRVLDIFTPVGIPLMVKINALTPVEVLANVAQHPSCDAIVCSNTIPWGKLPERIDWKGLFGSETSPLAKYEGFGNGGLSGAPLLPIVADWIAQARAGGIKKPIVGGGGVLSIDDAEKLIRAGASAVELGAVSILRPWRVHGIVKYVNRRMKD